MCPVSRRKREQAELSAYVCSQPLREDTGWDDVRTHSLSLRHAWSLPAVQFDAVLSRGEISHRYGGGAVQETGQLRLSCSSYTRGDHIGIVVTSGRS